MTRTFVDASVLIAAARGEAVVAEPALRLLEDPSRAFLASRFLRLELLAQAGPIPAPERAFYSAYLVRCERVLNLERVCALAEEEAQRCGLPPLDALHVAAAHLLQADELVTAERDDHPIHRATLVTVVPLPAPETLTRAVPTEQIE